MKKIVIGIIFIIGLITTFLIPPFAKPDEPVHFAKTLEVASGKIFCKNNQSFYLNDKYKEIYNLSSKYGLAGNNIYTFPIFEYKRNIFHTNNKYVESKTAYCHLNSLPYLILAFGIKTAELLQLNSIYSFFLGRFLNFIFIFIILSIISIKSGHFFWFLLLPISFPVTLQQLGAYSYDGITILFFYLYFFFFTKNIKLKSAFKSIISILFLIAAIFSKNLFYFPLILLIFLEFYHFLKVKNKKLQIFLTSIFLIIFAFALSIIIKKVIIPTLYINKNDFVFKSIIDPKLQLKLITSYPNYFIDVFFNNLYEKQHFLITSLIGNMEWLNFTLSSIVIFIYFAMILKIISAKINYSIDLKKVIFIFFTINSFIILIFLYLYLTWTTIGSNQIEGFQGRYLIPIMPLIIFCLNYFYNKYKSKINLALFTFLFLIIFIDFYKRHYDYSKAINTSNLPTLTKKTIDLGQNFYQENISTKSGRKIMAFYLNYQGQIPNPPFSIEVYDNNCQKIKNYKVVPTNSLNKNDNIVFIKPLISSNNYCIKINTFNIKFKPNQFKFNYFKTNDNKEVLFYPLTNF